MTAQAWAAAEKPVETKMTARLKMTVTWGVKGRKECGREFVQLIISATDKLKRSGLLHQFQENAKVWCLLDAHKAAFSYL
jgi:hypothetical protein